MTAIAWAQRGIGRLEPADKPLLDAFQQANFGPHSLPVRPDYHQWMYEDVPHPDVEGPQFWVCKRNGAIVGQQCGIPFLLQAGDRVTRASWAIDLMVAPEWRLRGVGPALSEAHAMASPVSISLGMTDAAYKSYKRTGWTDLGTIPTWVRLIDAPRCVRVSPFKGPLVTAAGAVGGPLLSGLSMGGNALARLRGASLELVPAFDERADTLWEAAKNAHPALGRRDRQTLAWRFDRLWACDRLRRFYVVKRGEVMGYVVLRVDEWKGEPVGVVLDYLARPGWTGAAFALTVELARRERMTALLCRTLNARAVRTFNALGFLSLKNGVRFPTRVMARIGQGGDPFKAVVSDPKSWLITAFDSDIGFKGLGE